MFNNFTATVPLMVPGRTAPVHCQLELDCHDNQFVLSFDGGRKFALDMEMMLRENNLMALHLEPELINKKDEPWEPSWAEQQLIDKLNELDLNTAHARLWVRDIVRAAEKRGASRAQG